MKGFRDPIRSAIASFAATHGPEFDREALKAKIRETIDNAPKRKDRKASDIERYQSDKELDDLIESAVKKYGLTGPARRVAEMLPWREVRPNGFPLPSMHNARLAITALGIECSYDTFHNKMLVGFQGDNVRHELRTIVGEISDNVIICLRQCLSDEFGFDLTRARKTHSGRGCLARAKPLLRSRMRHARRC